jgi:hypothetical protein
MFDEKAGGTSIEEDAGPFPGFQCVPTAVESAFTTPMGRSACFLQSGAGPEVRYGSDGVLYRIYPLPPLPKVGNSDMERLLGGVVDSLQ